MRWRLGIKFGTEDIQYVPEINRMHAQGLFDYIELFIIPGTVSPRINAWITLQKQGIPFVIHAPHFMKGFNLARSECFAGNKAMLAEVLRAADLLQASFIIMHPGINGTETETIRQLSQLRDPRMLIENKPYHVITGEPIVCNGYAPEHIQAIMESCGVGFCWDIGHALCAANAVKESQHDYCARFLQLNPSMVHVSDGDRAGLLDQHAHIGSGSYPLRDILPHVSADCMMTIETEKSHTFMLADLENDIAVVRTMESTINVNQ